MRIESEINTEYVFDKKIVAVVSAVDTSGVLGKMRGKVA
jgi:hypothetical protein